MLQAKRIFLTVFLLMFLSTRISGLGMSGVFAEMELETEGKLETEGELEKEGEVREAMDEGRPEVSAPSAVLMEASTGTVIYEKDGDTARAPASVTKVMTLLLIFEALEDGMIALEDEVTTSEHAASMGGSQVFLEPGETQTVDTLIKCISVSSANDAAVAMAEYISGNEEEFVRRMNRKAEELGMNHTHFVNCCGLDEDGHLTSARDIALMSRELIVNHPEIHEYCTIWMDNMTHETRKGTTEFGLTNTNKLIRQYEYATGLKTGSTDEARFCISATAEKNGVHLIAVIMGAENSKARFKDAVTLLNYGFGKCQVYTDTEMPPLPLMEVENGVKDQIRAEYEAPFSWLDLTGANLNLIEKSLELREHLEAPVKVGEEIGAYVYTVEGEEIGRVRIIASESVERAGFKDYFQNIIRRFLLFFVF